MSKMILCDLSIAIPPAKQLLSIHYFPTRDLGLGSDQKLAPTLRKKNDSESSGGGPSVKASFNPCGTSNITKVGIRLDVLKIIYCWDGVDAKREMWASIALRVELSPWQMHACAAVFDSWETDMSLTPQKNPQGPWPT